MRTALLDLYQQLILDHNRKPHNRRRLEEASAHAQGNNPLCGDQLIVYLAIEDNVIRDASFEGHGCAISTASASLMTDAVKGRTLDEARSLFEMFHQLVIGEAINGDAASTEVAVPDDSSIRKLDAFAGVGQYPARVKCATLAWHTLKAAIDQSCEVVTTE